MTGIFDSGLGGLAALSALREAAPLADIIYLADRENAPYGTKSREELLPLVIRDIERLSALGAERVLMACCTASTVYESLPVEYRRIAVPIIRPTAEAALAHAPHRIAAIATKRTVLSHAFRDTVAEMSAGAELAEFPTQELVALVEGGAKDGHICRAEEQRLAEILKEARDFRPDVLILGCTHFSHLSGEVGKLFENTKIIDSAREGARALMNMGIDSGTGRTIYL